MNLIFLVGVVLVEVVPAAVVPVAVLPVELLVHPVPSIILLIPPPPPQFPLYHFQATFNKSMVLEIVPRLLTN